MKNVFGCEVGFQNLPHLQVQKSSRMISVINSQYTLGNKN